jgi:hypothetical protein
MSQYILSMRGLIQRARGYGQDGLELAVTVTFDAKQFNAIKKSKACPLAAGMSQIKNVVLDAIGVRGVPSYASQSYTQRFPRAKGGQVTLTVYFDVSTFTANALGVDTKDYFLRHTVDLNTTLEATRNDGHLFAKSAIAQNFGH